MTANQMIEKVDRLRPNQVSEADKLQWIAQLEDMIRREIVRNHEGGEGAEAESVTEDTVLSAPTAYEEMYLHWLELHIAYANDELERYNNAAQAFGRAFSDYRNWYNREHVPVQSNGRLRFL